MAARTQPDAVHWCDGSAEEYDALAQVLVDAGTFERLSDAKRPNSYLALSDPSDVARVEDRTFICSEREEDAGPTNNWTDPAEMREKLDELFEGSMRGRTMYVVPFSMGPLGSPISEVGVQLTDSAYVACSMRIMTRMGAGALDQLGEDGTFVPCLHTVGAPLAEGEEDVPWPCNPEKYIVHFPETREIWSYGSGYGGNALLGKKCFALRIASRDGARRGLARRAHADPQADLAAGRVQVRHGRLPVGLRQDQPRDADPDARGLDRRDGRRRHRLDEVRRRRPPVGDQPRGGLLRRRARHGREDQPERDGDDRARTRSSPTAPKTDDGDVWWEGMTPEPPAHAIDWHGNDWTPQSDEPAAHPNARFTTPAAQDPAIAPDWEDPKGVPVDAMLFGGRRSTVVPLIHEAFDWDHGVFLGAQMSSETTAAAAGEVGKLRRDPLAMLPFCGYHMADYWAHWLKIGRREGAVLPKIFYVNWFRKDLESGRFLWPGFGENSRVLEWVFRRCDDAVEARDTPIGRVPTPGSLNTEGLDMPEDELEQILAVDPEQWKAEIPPIREFFDEFGDRLPPEVAAQLDALEERLNRA